MSKRFQSWVAGCRKLIAAAETHEVELPSLGCFRVALEEALEDVTVSKTRKINLDSKRREAAKEARGRPRCRPRGGGAAEELREGQLRPEG